MAEFMVLRYEPTQDPPWVPVGVSQKTLEEGGEAAVHEIAEPGAAPRYAAVRWDDRVELEATVSLAVAEPLPRRDPRG